MTSWKRTLIVVWLSQFFSVAGFSFGMPFAAYYLQELGAREGKEIWVAVFSAAMPMTLAVFSPIWGYLSDRFGHRIMMIRAYVGGSVVLFLMSLARTPHDMIVLRLLQGVFTGTVTTAQTMVAAAAPLERSGAALGMLSMAQFCGHMIGAAVGGLLAEILGYRVSFACASVILLVALVLTVWGTREPVPPNDVGPESLVLEGPIYAPHSSVAGTMGILGLISLMTAVRQFDGPLVPLLVQEINKGRLSGASLQSGILSATGAIAGMVAGFFLGRLADRRDPLTIAKACSAGAALASVPQAVTTRFAYLVVSRFAMAFFIGGLDPVFLIWLSKVTPKERRGAVFGWAGTARSVGWIVAPLVSGGLATHLGIRTIFLIEAILFLLLIPCIGGAVRQLRQEHGTTGRIHKARHARGEG